MSTIEKIKEKMKAYEEQHPDATELFEEILGVIEYPLWFFCEEEAYYRLENLGIVNPSEERVQSIQKWLHDSEGFVDAETASNITDREVDEMPVLLSELLKPGEQIRELELKTGRQIQYIEVPECKNVLECLESERQRLREIYWQNDAKIAGIMGVDLSRICNGGEEVRVTCGRGNRMLSGCQYCAKYYDGCKYLAEAKRLLEEYAELAE